MAEVIFMLRQKMLELLESHSRQLKRMGVYIAVVLFIFAIFIPLMGRQIAKEKAADTGADLTIPAVEEQTGARDRIMEVLPINDREKIEEKNPVEPKHENSVAAALKEETGNKQETQVLAADIKTIIWPVKGEIIQQFGMGYSRTFSDYRYHNGIDIKVKMGTEIRSALPGKLVKLETTRSHGKLCVIDHGSGWQSMYSHLDEVYLKAGDSLKPGQVLGSAGQPGLNEILEGPHLHFTLYKDNKEVNPLDYLPK